MKKSPDYILLFIVLALLSIGLIMVFSASPTMAMKLGDPYYYLKRQILFMILGFLALLLGFKIDYNYLKEWSPWFLGGSICLLLLLFIPGLGQEISGAVRWLNLGLFSFQPSEITKLALIVYLSSSIADKKDKIKNFLEGLLPLLLLIMFITFLIIRQPDLGTTLVILGTSGLMLFVGEVQIAHLFGLAAVGLAGLLGLILASPYRLRRIVAFINPWQDPRSAGFHIIQSLLAVGSGGPLGLGLGQSRQKFFYLPQQVTDFIFAILCEELGFIGGLIVITLFALFIIRGLKISREAPDKFTMLLSAGITGWIAIQALINISVVIGLLPTTGIPLPFISYGGTSLLVLLFSIGLLLNISQVQELKT